MAQLGLSLTCINTCVKRNGNPHGASSDDAWSGPVTQKNAFSRSIDRLYSFYRPIIPDLNYFFGIARCDCIC